MNRSLIVALGVFASCTGPVRPSTTVVTLVGEPSGTPTTVRVGQGGGTLTTPQGELTVSVPAGALSGDVELSATPITSKVPGAVGGAWRLGPEGVTFSSPVSLAFKYTSAMVAGTTVKHLQVASQNSDRTWSYATDRTVDASTKTITVQSTHFSDWSLARDDGSEAPEYRRLTAKYSGQLTQRYTKMTVQDAFSVLLPYPFPVGAYGEGGEDGPIPDTFELKNEATTVGAVNDVRAGCPAPSLMGSLEFVTITEIGLRQGQIQLSGSRVIPPTNVGAGSEACVGGTETIEGVEIRQQFDLLRSSFDWIAAGQTTTSFTDTKGWTWSIGPN